MAKPTKFAGRERLRHPRRRNKRAKVLADAVQDRQSASYKIQPRKFLLTVISVFSVNSEIMSAKIFIELGSAGV